MGGGVMRSAAKVAAVGGYRPSPVADQAVAASVGAWRAPKPPPASAAVVTPSGGGTSAVSVISSFQNAQVGVPVGQRQQQREWEVDGWEFAGGREEELFDAVHPAPRLVFGPPPTLEEAREATVDLKDAVEKLYFTSSRSCYEGSAVGQKHMLSGSKSSENLEGSLCARDGHGSVLVHSAPNHVIQAFSLLRESPEVQSVVTSLASDKNVWDAVMKNEKVMEFYKSQQTFFQSETCSSAVSQPEDAVVENLSECLSEKSAEEDDGFWGLVNIIKVKVSDMINSLSDLFQYFMGISTESSDAKTEDQTASRSFDMVVGGATFMALGVAVILVILLKRA